FTVGADQVATGKQFGVDVGFDDIYIGDDGPRPAGQKYFPPRAAQLAAALNGGAARSHFFTSGVEKYAPAATAPKLTSLDRETYVIAGIDDLQRRDEITRPVTKGEAYAALAAHVRGNPDDKSTLQVVPL